MKKNILLLCLLPLFFSCASASKDVQVYFVNNKKLQYFLPEQHWISSDSTLSLDGDFLFRSYRLEGEEESRTIFNFTLISDAPALIHQNPIESLSLLDGEETRLYLEDISVLFADISSVRYTSWVNSSSFAEYLKTCEDPALFLETERENIRLIPKGSGFSKYIDYFKTVNPAANDEE